MNLPEPTKRYEMRVAEVVEIEKEVMDLVMRDSECINVTGVPELKVILNRILKLLEGEIIRD